MSAAILVSQTWQPTVLQLMPFSNNNASAVGSRTDSNGRNRDFPTLAVTRSHDDWVAHLQASSKVQRATSERMPRSHYNQLTGRPSNSKRAQSEYKVREKPKPEANLEKTCSVIDLNNKIINTTNQERQSPNLITSGTVSITEIHGLSKPLQNPMPQKAWDSHYYLPQNGFWRAMTLTPGELDLQKHRDVMNKERRTKKLKLNINQLPRSNTPIIDNDPDKLNMQQVIQFLKTHNEGSDEPKPRLLERNKYERDKEYLLKKRGCTSASVDIANKPQRNGIQTKPPLDGTVQRYSRDMVMSSTRSSPLVRGRVNKQVTGQKEWRHVWDRDSVHIPGGTNKPFRLHRFLNMASQDTDSNNILTRAQMQLPSYIPKTLEISEHVQLPKTKHDLHKFDPHHKCISSAAVERHCRLAYRLPAKRLDDRTEINRNATPADRSHAVGIDGTVIRLPSMHDFKTDSDNESDADDNIQSKTDLDRQDSNQSFGSLTVQIDSQTIQANKVAFDSPKTFPDTGFNCPGELKSSLKKLHVSVPRESQPVEVNVPKPSAECVKLSLRQERGLTREHTYMTDLNKSKSTSVDNRDTQPFPVRKTSSISVENKSEKDDDDVSSRTS